MFDLDAESKAAGRKKPRIVTAAVLKEAKKVDHIDERPTPKKPEDSSLVD